MLKIKIILIILLLTVGSALTGCGEGSGQGSNEGPGNVKRPGSEEGSESVEGPGSAAESGSDAERGISLNKMELLQSNDPENENLADMLQKAGSRMMVQIQAGELLGSGVICGAKEDQLLILTAAHVLQEAEEGKGDVLVTFSDESQVSAGAFECFDTGDFALVRVQGGDIPPEGAEQYLYANIDKTAFDQVTAGTGCIVMGSRSDVAAEAYEGVILDNWIYMEDYGQYMMWVKAEAQPGMSGGGLFDRQGHFLGILSGTNEDGELAVVPLSLILTEVDLLP